MQHMKERGPVLEVVGAVALLCSLPLVITLFTDPGVNLSDELADLFRK